MLSNISSQISTFIETSKLYMYPWLLCLSGLWVFNIINWILGSKFNALGIYPRHLTGLIGIIFSPFLHQNFNHLFFNSIPLFVLGLAVLAQGVPVFGWVSVIVIVIGGLGVWLFGSRGLHIGASGLVSGYFGYILATAYWDPSIITLLLGLLVIYYFGSIFLGIFPQEERISWESHLFGFLSGIGSAYVLSQI